jgi:hypothetical protein
MIKELKAAGILIALCILVLSVPGSIRSESGDAAEKEAVLKAARIYLDAEVRRDYPRLYACFAPSSIYVRSHTYRQFLEDVRTAPDRLVAYRIVRVSYIQDQEDRKKFPTIDKVAQVEVEATFLNAPTQKRSEVNIGFIFLREKGKWYKG